MANRNWIPKPDQIEDIKNLYEMEKISMINIGKKYGVSEPIIKRLLEQHGVSIRTRAQSNQKITQEQIQEFIKRYNNGESTNKIAKDHGCTHRTVSKNLKAAGITIRSKSYTRTNIRRNYSKEIIQKYESGISLTDLSKKYKCSMGCIRNILLDNNSKLRSKSEAFGFPAEKYHSQICERYRNRETLSELGRSFNVGHHCIKKLLEMYAVEIRGVSSARALANEVCDEIAKRYIDGATASILAKEYGTSITYILDVLRDRDIKTNTSLRQFIIPLKEHQNVCKRYIAGDSSVKIAFDYGVVGGSVLRLLRYYNIDIRESGSGSDSINSLLMGEDNFAEVVENDFYIYSLLEQEEYLKIGISYNHEIRKADSDGQYNEALLVQRYPSRHHAYLIEQAILSETNKYASFPDSLAGWSGYSEVRRMPFEDVENIFIFFDNEINELGIWEFAARYIPMTKEEKIRCLENLNQ